MPQINETRTQQNILFSEAVTVFHGGIKLLGFQQDPKKPCS